MNPDLRYAGTGDIVNDEYNARLTPHRHYVLPYSLSLAERLPNASGTLKKCKRLKMCSLWIL